MNQNITQKTALITGITGQDGAYLAALLLDKGYIIHGIQRRSSSPNTSRIDQYIHGLAAKNGQFHLHYGDVTDSSNIIRLINDIRPDEIYNLAAQSHVQISFDIPEYTANTDGLGALRILEAIRILGLEKTCKYYQAGTSELFGNAQSTPQDESTPFCPNSPYATAKLYAYWLTKNYRDAYGIFACNGILFNHESPLRGEDFVTRKITKAVAAYHHDNTSILYLGNINAQRDWGHARDYVIGMWNMMQHDTADDFVLASGQTYSVRQFVNMAFAHIGVDIIWEGSGIKEAGINAKTGDVLVKIDPNFFRPSDVHFLCGNSAKAHQILGWASKTSLSDLIAEMVDADLMHSP